MPPRRKKSQRKPGIWAQIRGFITSLITSRYWPMSGIIAGVLLLGGVGSMVVGASLEEKDSFCASCHTQPESTYYLRSIEGAMVDLASAHKTKAVKCIDCHSGGGLTGRFEAFYVGGGDLIHWVTHTAIQPAPLLYPISDGNCIKCHGATENTQDFNRHFHAFLPRWQAVDKNAAHCVDCHSSHSTDGDPSITFLNKAHTTAICTRCHQIVGRG